MLQNRQYAHPPAGLRLALVQMNPTVGDLEGNAEKIRKAIAKAKGHEADIVVFPELALTGYPPEDLLLKPQFIADNMQMACGYATLYGDMAGGFAVIKDVPKTLVYKLAEFRNRDQEAIPRRTIDKEPTAELREGQKDVDSLPSYEILDPILRHYVEEDRSVEEIIHLGFDEETVRRVARLVDRNEYKRRQSPPCMKITPKAFGRDRRLPITNRYCC